MWDHVNFCSHFFHKQDTLDNTVDKVASGEAEKNPEELMNYRNRGESRTWLLTLYWSTDELKQLFGHTSSCTSLGLVKLQV
jgi:hypothetical protein